MAWKVRINFTDGSDHEVEDEFDSEEDATCEGDEWLDSWEVGKETLQLAGREYDDRCISDYEVYEE